MPNLYLIAGANGSGKTTIAKALLPNYFNCNEFVNADMVAEGIAPGDVARVAITAGKTTLTLIDKLIGDQISFAVETTLSGAVHQRIIGKAQANGYYVVLIYVWVRSARVSIARVKQRRKLGGHFVHDNDVIRRYQRGLVNLFRIYMDLCDYWAILDNTKPVKDFVAEGTGSAEIVILNRNTWRRIRSDCHNYEARA